MVSEHQADLPAMRGLERTAAGDPSGSGPSAVPPAAQATDQRYLLRPSATGQPRGSKGKQPKTAKSQRQAGPAAPEDPLTSDEEDEVAEVHGNVAPPEKAVPAALSLREARTLLELLTRFGCVSG